MSKFVVAVFFLVGIMLVQGRPQFIFPDIEKLGQLLPIPGLTQAGPLGVAPLNPAELFEKGGVKIHQVIQIFEKIITDIQEGIKALLEIPDVGDKEKHEEKHKNQHHSNQTTIPESTPSQ